MSIGSGTGKEYVVCTYSGLLASLKEEENADTCKNLVES